MTELPTMTAVESSNIEAVGYIAAEEELFVRFSGGAVYRYDDVPQVIHQAFMDARSKGSFFAQQIKGKFISEQIIIGQTPATAKRVAEIQSQHESAGEWSESEIEAMAMAGYKFEDTEGTPWDKIDPESRAHYRDLATQMAGAVRRNIG